MHTSLLLQLNLKWLQMNTNILYFRKTTIRWTWFHWNNWKGCGLKKNPLGSWYACYTKPNRDFVVLYQPLESGKGSHSLFFFNFHLEMSLTQQNKPVKIRRQVLGSSTNLGGWPFVFFFNINLAGCVTFMAQNWATAAPILPFKKTEIQKKCTQFTQCGKVGVYL